MSPGSGVKSEYMKRYREPRWDEYAPCYRELLHYRLGRRLLEQAHATWLWDDWGPAGSSDDSASSASSGAGSPAPQGAPESPPPPPPPPADTAAREDPARRARGPAEDTSEPALPVKDGKEKPEQQQVGAKEMDDSTSGCEAGPRPSAPSAGGARRAVRSPQRPSSKIKQMKHPFALYGWGERQTDTGSQKTHNVCASALVHEIHESALRAKNRRQLERRRLVAQRQRAHSADVEWGRGPRLPSAKSPWVTEYMRCYSARA